MSHRVYKSKNHQKLSSVLRASIVYISPKKKKSPTSKLYLCLRPLVYLSEQTIIDCKLDRGAVPSQRHQRCKSEARLTGTRRLKTFKNLSVHRVLGIYSLVGFRKCYFISVFGNIIENKILGCCDCVK